MRYSDVDLIVVHCAATKPNLDIGRDEIDDWHRARGWSGIGYHKVIRQNGEVENGRSLLKAGAHAYGYNRRSWGICLVGGLDFDGKAADTFSLAQYQSLERVIDEMVAKCPNDVKVCGHRDLSPDVDGDGVIERWEWKKECPSFEAAEFLRFRDMEQLIYVP